MSESAIWVFLFGTLSVYPFFSLRHVPVMGRMKVPFWKVMLLATVLMVAQGLSFLWLARQYPFGAPILIWNRKVFMFLYVLLTFVFSKDGKAKTLFMDFFMIGIIMAVIDAAYVLDRTWFASSFAIAPYRTDVLVRGSVTLIIYLPLYFFLKKVLRPIMKIESMSVWRSITAIAFVFAFTSVVTTMEAFGHQITPVILTIRFSLLCGSVLVCALLGKVVKQTEEAVIAQEKNKWAEQMLSLQGAQYEALTQSIEQTKAQRHDLHHQLTVIRSYSESGDTAKLTDYLDTLIAEIPDRHSEVYCENAAVNAIVSHYAALAEKSEIKLSVKLTVPEHSEQISDTSLCVIFGNLLENAIEACNHMGEGERFIGLCSRLQHSTLTITMDNSFDGKVTARDGRLISRKRTDYGTGTASITTVAEKHGGGADFETEGTVFKASVYVRV